MKLLFTILLTVSAAFAQARHDSLQAATPTVTYAWASPNCSGIADPISQLASGCTSPKLIVTARSFNSNIAGFYVLLSFSMAIENGYLHVSQQTIFTKNPDGSFSAAFFAGDPATTVISAISAVELFTGKLATSK